MFNSKYIADIRNFEILDSETNRELIAYYQATKDARAHQKIINGNMRMVLTVAIRYSKLSTFHTVEDYITEGYRGLLTAIENYDPTQGCFSTYAMDWIRADVSRAFYDTEDTIRLSRNRKQQLHRDKKAGKENTDALLSGLISLEGTSDDEERSTVAETIAGNDDVFSNYTEKHDPAVIRNTLVSTLDERSVRVVDLCFGLSTQEPMTLTEVGEVLGISAERVRQIRDKSLKTLQKGEAKEILMAMA